MGLILNQFVVKNIIFLYSRLNSNDSNDQNTPINLIIKTSSTMLHPMNTLDETELTNGVENLRKSTATKQ